MDEVPHFFLLFNYTKRTTIMQNIFQDPFYLQETVF